MTQVESLARFAGRMAYENLSAAARLQLKIRVLDSLGCAIGALDGDPVQALRRQIDEFGGHGCCTLIGGGHTAPDRAALYNTALVRYLDFMDSFLAKGETCHPSDNFGAVLAAAEYAGASGREFLAALAVAYQTQCRLVDAGPIMGKGFDHTTQLAFSIAAGVSKALALDDGRTAQALAIAGAGAPVFAIVRASPMSHWKGLASSATALAAVHATFLAARGVTGPLAVLEGAHGYMDALGVQFEVDWDAEDLELVTRTEVKRYNAEMHSQSAIEGLLELREREAIAPEAVEQIEAEIFLTAYDIIGGGAYGDRMHVETKEQADHSLPYLLAVALIDGELSPRQFAPERIRRADVQDLLQRVRVRPAVRVAHPKALVEQVDPYTRRYPEEMDCKINITLKDGRSVAIEKHDYEGFHTRPVTWARAVEKFEGLTARSIEPATRDAIVVAVDRLEELPLSALLEPLSRVKPQAAPAMP